MIGDRVKPQHPRRPSRRGQQPDQAADGGRLACPIGSEEAEHLPGLHPQIQPWIPTVAPYRLVSAASSITAVIVNQS
jgi:hypothetical protein